MTALRIRSDCGEIGEPIPRDVDQPIDLPATPVLPLIENSDPDNLFTWARNMVMSLEDWFNLLSSAVHDGDEGIRDLYECYCIALCTTTSGGTPCEVYECDALKNAILAGSPYSYWSMRNGATGHNGTTIFDEVGSNDMTEFGTPLADDSWPSLTDSCTGTSYAWTTGTVRTNAPDTLTNSSSGTIVAVVSLYNTGLSGNLSNISWGAARVGLSTTGEALLWGTNDPPGSASGNSG